MKAYTYIEKGRFELLDKPKPELLDPKDAIVRITLSEHLLQQGRVTVPARIQQCESAGDAVSYACYLDHKPSFLSRVMIAVFFRPKWSAISVTDLPSDHSLSSSASASSVQGSYALGFSCLAA